MGHLVAVREQPFGHTAFAWEDALLVICADFFPELVFANLSCGTDRFIHDGLETMELAEV
jgi:hypothetical protein